MRRMPEFGRADLSAIESQPQHRFLSRLPTATGCRGKAPGLTTGRDSLQANVDMMRRSLPTLQPLCAAAVPKEADALLKFPQAFADMTVVHPEASKPLSALWGAYIAHEDLRQALSIAGRESTMRILAWARRNALSGSNYDNGLLRDYESFFKHAILILASRWRSI